MPQDTSNPGKRYDEIETARKLKSGRDAYENFPQDAVRALGERDEDRARKVADRETSRAMAARSSRSRPRRSSR
jgi:hypothetical protein